MKHLYTLLLISFSISLFSQKTIEKEFKLSDGTTKTVKIYIPRGYETDTIKKYPVSFVLNDSYLFSLYKGNGQLFANEDLAPKQIIVGIPTSQEENGDVSVIEKTLGFTNKSAVFYSFLKTELLTYIKSNYKTSPFLSIVGENYAANFITYFLKESKPVFNAYICIAPQLNEQVNELIKSYDLGRLKDIDNTYFLYVSNSIFRQKKTTQAFNDLRTYLSSFENKSLKIKFDGFKKSPNIMSAVSESVPRAYSYTFELYRNISRKEYNEFIRDLEPLEAIKYLEERYINLEYLYGTNLNVRLEDIYAIEGIVMDKMDGDYLRVLGDFTLIKHPDLPLGDYYMGRFYELGEDYETANSYYKTGFGKMAPSDPNADNFYKNIERVTQLINSQPKKKPLPIEDEPIEEDDKENEESE